MTYPPQPPPYNAPQGVPPTQAPNNNLVLAILVTVLCCLPFGIVSIINAAKVNGLWAQGQYAAAQKASEDAKKWAIWGAIAGVIAIVIYILIGVAGGGFAYMS
jgi:Interferon-induced transmembrane protein